MYVFWSPPNALKTPAIRASRSKISDASMVVGSADVVVCSVVVGASVGSSVGSAVGSSVGGSGR